MIALDVHVAILPETPCQWVDRCIKSVRIAAERASFPVHIHVVPGEPGHVGIARGRGYACGSAPFVTYVDDDDEVLPEAFAVLPLHRNPSAVFTAELMNKNGARLAVSRRHNLSVYRRDVLAGVDFGAWRYAIDAHCRRLAVARDDVIDVPQAVYVWNVRMDSPARQLARGYSGANDEMERAING